jgi:hypothetical protein
MDSSTASGQAVNRRHCLRGTGSGALDQRHAAVAGHRRRLPDQQQAAAGEQPRAQPLVMDHPQQDRDVVRVEARAIAQTGAEVAHRDPQRVGDFGERVHLLEHEDAAKQIPEADCRWKQFHQGSASPTGCLGREALVRQSEHFTVCISSEK